MLKAVKGRRVGANTTLCAALGVMVLLGAHTGGFHAGTAAVAQGAIQGGPSPSPGPNV